MKLITFNFQVKMWLNVRIIAEKRHVSCFPWNRHFCPALKARCLVMVKWQVAVKVPLAFAKLSVNGLSKATEIPFLAV